MKSVAYLPIVLILILSIQPVHLRSPPKFKNSTQDANTTSFSTLIILGNQYTSKAEIYMLTFECNPDGCRPLPLDEGDLMWSSPDTKGISEVKYVNYSGRPAILATTDNGAIVYEFPSGTVLFHKELESSYYINVHSAEVLPDGNVVVAGSFSNGIFSVLYPDGNNTNQAIKQTVSARAPFGHGVVYDKERNWLYAAGYLTFLVLDYRSGKDKRGSFKVVKNISLAYLYDEPNKNENAIFEDGVHDLYPVDGSSDTLWLTTGEHVFTINVTDFSINKYDNLFIHPSHHSNKKKVAVKNKGGVKGISSDKEAGLVLAKTSPWFKEWMSKKDENYSPHDPNLIWIMQNKNSSIGYCTTPDFDLTDNCKINFDNLEPIWFYKARIFTRPKISNYL